MRVRAILILATMVLGGMLLSGVALGDHPGGDHLNGDKGADRIVAVDGDTDDYVNCGGGNDEAWVDGDVDPPEIQEASVEACEIVYTCSSPTDCVELSSGNPAPNPPTAPPPPSQQPDRRVSQIFQPKKIQGTAASETINGNNRSNEIHGAPGNDTLNGKESKDWLYGERDNDTLNGGKGDDILSGGPGDDTHNGNDGKDLIVNG